MLWCPGRGARSPPAGTGALPLILLACLNMGSVVCQQLEEENPQNKTCGGSACHQYCKQRDFFAPFLFLGQEQVLRSGRGTLLGCGCCCGHKPLEPFQGLGWPKFCRPPCSLSILLISPAPSSRPLHPPCSASSLLPASSSVLPAPSSFLPASSSVLPAPSSSVLPSLPPIAPALCAYLSSPTPLRAVLCQVPSTATSVASSQDTSLVTPLRCTESLAW